MIKLNLIKKLLSYAYSVWIKIGLLHNYFNFLRPNVILVKYIW